MMCAAPPISDVCIIGLGYVGLTLAVALAECGYRIYGVEINSEILKNLRAGKPHFHETGLGETYARHFGSGAISIHASIPSACPATVFVITVGTPVTAQKNIDLMAIQSVSKTIAQHLKPSDLVVLRSTVKVGCTRQTVKPILDAAGVPYYLAMCPERTVEGKALEELRSLPQLIGGMDEISTARAAALFSPLTAQLKCYHDPETVELAKLVCNTQRDLFFAYANEVALMSAALGLDSAQVIAAANDDYPRSRVAKPGLVGGPCMEKDGYILSDSLRETGLHPQLVMTGRALNEAMIPYAIAQVQSLLQQRGQAASSVKKIAVLGLAFKGTPAVQDLRGSLAITLMAQLKQQFTQAEIVGYDAVASVEEAAKWGLPAVATLAQALEHADIVFIQNNHAAFGGAALKPYLSSLAPGAILYDFWRCTAPDLCAGLDILHAGLGMGAAKANQDPYHLFSAPDLMLAE